MNVNRCARRRTAVAAAVAVGTLVVAAGVAAADSRPVQLTTEGQAAARAAVVQRADLGGATGWTGGAKKPDTSSQKLCAGFDPKDSDLVLNGTAETEWKHRGLQLNSYADVLRTPEMVRLDWQRSVLSPKFLPCIRSLIRKGMDATEHLVSLRRVSVPPLAPQMRLYRALVDVKEGQMTIRMMVDMLLMGNGRTEITLMSTAPFVAEPVVRDAELRLARSLLSRCRA